MWHVAQLKSGGLIVFKPVHTLDTESRQELRRRYKWVSSGFSSQAKAATFLQRHIRSLPNPPATLTVVHKGTIHVQHMRDTKTIAQRIQIGKRKSNPPRQWHEKELQSLKGLLALSKDLGMTERAIDQFLGAIVQEKNALREHDRMDKIIRSNPHSQNGSTPHGISITVTHRDVIGKQIDTLHASSFQAAKRMVPKIKALYKAMGFVIVDIRVT